MTRQCERLSDAQCTGRKLVGTTPLRAQGSLPQDHQPLQVDCSVGVSGDEALYEANRVSCVFLRPLSHNVVPILDPCIGDVASCFGKMRLSDGLPGLLRHGVSFGTLGLVNKFSLR